jgi:archaellum component FlaC
VTEGNGVNPAGSSSRLDRIENALEVLIAQQQALTAQQQESAARQEVFMRSTNERLDRHEEMITNAVLGYVNMGEALMERIDTVAQRVEVIAQRVEVIAQRVEVIAQRVEVMAEQVVRIVTHLDTVSLQVLGLQTENRRILDILQGR